MLPDFFRFLIYNDTTQTQAYDTGARFEVEYKMWKFDSSGNLSYGTSVLDTMNFGAGQSVAYTGFVSGSDVDNSSNKYLGLFGTVRVVADHASTNGSCYLYIEWSSDTGNSYPSENTDFVATKDAKLVDVVGDMNASTRNDVSVPFEFSL